jgi:hypothetical protein
LNWDGPNDLTAAIQGSIPRLTLLRGEETVVVKSKRLAATFQVQGDKTTFYLEELHLDHPQLNASGNLSVDRSVSPDAPEIRVDLAGTNVDVQSTRQAALTLGGDNSTLKKIFEVLKEGHVPTIRFKTRGRSVAELGKLENIVIQGQMIDGKIFTPGADLNLEDVKGDAVISKGVLKGSNLEARYGKTTGRSGTLTLGLAEGNDRFHLDIAVQADLSRLPFHLKGWVNNRSFVAEMNRIRRLNGKATGRLILGERITSIQTRVEVTNFELSAAYQRIPYPLKVSSGQFFYDPEHIEVKNLRGQMASSSFSGLTALIKLKPAAFLDIQTGKFNLFLDQIYSWLSNHERLANEIKNLKAVKGTVSLSAVNLKGPLLRPDNWKFQTSGKVKNLTVNWSLLPGPIAVQRGNFKANAQKLFFTEAAATILDASYIGAGTLTGYLKRLQRVDLKFQGHLGSQSTQWVSDWIRLPRDLRLRSPLQVNQARLNWARPSQLSFSGNLMVNKGPKIAMDFGWNPAELKINRLSIQDDVSDASLTLNLKKKALDIKFVGNLSQKTSDAIFVKQHMSSGWITGDFKARILIDQPLQSSAHGNLEGKDIIFPRELGVPVKIDALSLDAVQNKIGVKSAAISWGERRIDLKGNVKISKKEFLLDMDLGMDGCTWDELQNLLPGENHANKGKTKETFLAVPLRGNLRVHSKYFKYGRFTWSPIQASITFRRDEIDVAVGAADLCGISTPGVLKISPSQLRMDFKPNTQDQDLAPAIDCLLDKKEIISGSFDIEGQIETRGMEKTLIKALQGDMNFTAREGRIYRYGALAKIFALLNVTEIYKGKLPDVSKEGFAYKTIRSRTNIQNGKLILEEMHIDGASMGIVCQGDIDLNDNRMNVTVLVAPLKTVDSIIKHIPLVNIIFNGTLVSVPFRVTGNIADPKVTPLSPSAVGSGLFGILKRTIKLPIKIVQPILPGKNKK